MSMSQAQLETYVERIIADSSWWDSSEIQANQKAALDSYYSRNKPKVTDGRSAAVSTDVADMVEAVTAQIMSSYDYHEIGLFPPVDARDVDQARVESIAVNDHLMNKSDGYTELQAAIRNALLLRNGIVKVWPEEQKRVVTHRYRGLDALELAQAMEPTSPNQTVELVSSSGDDDAINASIRKTTVFRSLQVRSIDPTNFIFPREWDEYDLGPAPFSGERYFLTESDLRLRGHSKRAVRGIPSVNSDTHIASRSRDRGVSNPVREDHGDPAGRLIECFELYCRVDYDQDGITELRRLLYAGGMSGGTVLENEPYARVPYASGTGFLAPQRWLGISLYDKLRHLEDIKGDALRQYLDNLAFANNSEVVVVDGAVEMDDLKARRPGGINRADQLDAVRSLEVRSNGTESIQLLQYMDSVRSERGGASLDLQAANLQIAGDTAHGIERQFESREMLAQLMTRTIAETLVRQVFLLLHDTMRREFPEATQIATGGGFVSFAPGDWRHRDQVDIVAGISKGEREQRRGAIETVLIQQEKLHQAGLGQGILMDLRTYHAALIDWTAAGGIRDSRRYWIDPRSQESLQAQQQAAQSAQQQQAQQAAQQQQFLDAQLQLNRETVVGDLAQKRDELSFKYWDAVLKSSVDEQRIDAQYGTDESEPEAVDINQAEGARRASA